MNRSSTRALIGVAVALAGTASADIDWFGHFSSDRIAIVSAVDFDNAGNMFVLGIGNGIVDLDPGPGRIEYDLGNYFVKTFIVKLDPQGEYVSSWIIGRNDSGDVTSNRLIIRNEVVYIQGHYNGSIDFDPGPGTAALHDWSGADFLLRLTTRGEFISVWSDFYLDMHAVDVGENGNVHIFGNVTGAADLDFGPGVVTATEIGRTVFSVAADGLYRWHYVMPGVSRFRIAFVDAYDNIVVTGSFTGSVDFDPGPTAYFLSSDGWNEFYWVLRDDGSFVAAQSSNMDGIALRDETGSVYIARSFSNSIDVDPGPGVVELVDTSVPYVNDGYLLKLDSTGGFEWVLHLHDTSIGDIAFDNRGRVIVVAALRGELQLEVAGRLVDFVPQVGLMRDGLVLTVSPQGKVLAAEHFFAEPMKTCEFSLLRVNHDKLFVGGYFEGTVDFEPRSGSYIVPAVGDFDGFLIRLGEPRPLPVRSAGRYALAMALVLASLVLIGGRCARKT